MILAAMLVAFAACETENPQEGPQEVCEECGKEPCECPEEKPEALVDKEYHIAQLIISTEDVDGDGKPDWVPVEDKKRKIPCTITIDHPYDGWDLTEATGYVRGRGNSTWLWYDKKPYRFKLDEKVSVLGLAEEKDWVLLANYRDPSNLMNTFVFELGQEMGLPYTNHSRYVELTFNGESLGLYQLTEQVEQGSNRVNVHGTDGYLISLDLDDGPSLSPDAGDNFWSKVYGMPVCVKHPEDGMTDAKYNEIRDDLGKVESKIKNIRSNKNNPQVIQKNYDELKEIFDVQSMIDYLIIQELVYNVELAAPRSMYMHKDKGGKWYMGPLWDFDAGFDFDWGTMYTGHKYFGSYKKLVLGTDPVHHTNGNGGVPEFFTDLFRCEEFKVAYQERWAEISPKILTDVWTRVEKYAEYGKAAWDNNAEIWPIYLDDARPSKATLLSWEEEIDKLYVWLNDRIEYLDTVIPNYKDN